MSVLLIKSNDLIYCQVATFFLQNILNLKVCDRLGQGAVPCDGPGVATGGCAVLPEKCPPARAVSLPVIPFVKSLLSCKDCQIFPQLAST